jgi:threonylcarbamoyladenosine tRNA methylthiotransferase MtaB
MNRQYTGAEFAHAVALIRSAIPEAAITTDIIVGFPGETQAEFAESYEFCKKMDFARIHVFPYSARLGTRAAALSGRVNEDMKKTRTAAMLVLGGECVSNFSRNFLNQTLSVLFEQQEKGFWSGLTDNYIRVYVESADDLTNRLIRVRLQELFREGLRGEPA